MHLNADKYVFGVGACKFLGYMMTHQGIKVNPDQISVIEQLKPPSNSKEVQRLTRMVAALNRFVSKSAYQCRPFYRLLKKSMGFQWTKKCEQDFQDLKKYLKGAPILIFAPS